MIHIVPCVNAAAIAHFVISTLKPLIAAGLLGWCCSCSSLHHSTGEETFKRKFSDYSYCEIGAVRQTTQKSCGLACLASLLKYWDKPATEADLVRRYPIERGIGYPLQQLQAISAREGLPAFAVSMSQTGQSPAVALSQHLQRGRPIIVAVYCPQGRYFGEPLPVIESLDRRTWKPFGLGNTFKHHYVVVIGENAANYLVMDPAYGIGFVRKQSLLDWWSDEGYAALICSPSEDSSTLNAFLSWQEKHHRRISSGRPTRRIACSTCFFLHAADAMSSNDLWQGLNAEARARLETRSYARPSLGERLSSSGAEAGELAGGPTPELASAWIPGVEVFKRAVWQQKHRGWFAEFARRNDPASVFTRIEMWPQQWATALMFAGTAKGFHIHPPFIPDRVAPETWFRRLFIDEPQNYTLRPYDREQWDAMFFVRGSCEMFLVDERSGLPRRKMRFSIEGDDRPGPNNVGVVIPAGVAHAIRPASAEDLVMVYGTSTQFIPENEGRIVSEVEKVALPAEWAEYFGG